MKQVIRLFIFLFSFFFIIARGDDTSLQTKTKHAVTINLAGTDYLFDDIDSVIEEPFVIEKITYDSDVFLSPEEFAYLVPFKKGSSISAVDLKKACVSLAQKNKFQTVHITVTENENEKSVAVHLVGLWTFNKVKFHGILLGKDSYRQYYLLEPGEPFSIQQHQHCISKIKESFHMQGYFSAVVED